MSPSYAPRIGSRARGDAARRLAARLLVVLALVGAFVATLTTSASKAHAADDICLPPHLLMNLNDADDLLRGTVVLPSSVTVQIGPGDVDWARTSLDISSARRFYSLQWVEELVRESRETQNPDYLERAVEIVLDFATDNPPGAGPDPDDAWYPMFAGQRTSAIACVADASGDERVRAALAEHAEWIAGQVGTLDDWNQAIPPYLGLLMAGCELDSEDWRAQASSGFARLITSMIDDEGALLEQAPGYGSYVWYQWSNVELEFVLCELDPIPEIPERRAALLEWMAWLTSPDGTTAPIGDTFTTEAPPTPEGSPTAYVVPGGTTGTPPEGTQRVFSAGYVVGRDTWTDLASSNYWTLRFGPPRDLHGHEDHTSVTFWVDGRELLTDSGHAGYDDAVYRESLRAPEAHNVLLLPDTEFDIRQPTQLLRSLSGHGWRFDEVRDYVYDAPRTRGVLVLPDDGVMVVHDAASRATSGPFDQLWHLPAGADVLTVEAGKVVARHPDGGADIHVLAVPLPGDDVGSTSIVEGQIDPPLGWFSNANGHRTPAPVAKMSRTGTTVRMITVITSTPVGGSVSAQTQQVDGGWVIDLHAGGGRHEIGVGLDGSMQLGQPAPVVAIEPGGRRCVAVSGAPGDAAVVNLTPVLAGASGNGQLLSSDVAGIPNASNVNFSAGSVDPNVAIAPIGADGEVCFQNSVHTIVHLVADQLGTIPGDVYQPATPDAAPLRVLDTRVRNRIVTAGGRRCFGVVGQPGDAALVNLTPILARGPGNGQLLSSDLTDTPNASNVNFAIDTVDPNVAIAPIGADGQVCFQNSVHSSVHLVADQLGTIPAAVYQPATPDAAPLRVLDTRAKPRIVPPGGRRCFPVSGQPGDAAIVNLTPVLAEASGNGQLVSSDLAHTPTASNVNYGAGTVDPNVAIAPIGIDGRVCFKNSFHTSVHLIADQLGTIPAGAYAAASVDAAPLRVLDTRLS